MLSHNEIMETIQMIDQQHLDVRTITMGISLLSCAHSDTETACTRIYDKIIRCAEKLVATGEAIEKEFGIPIVNKRISVTPVALVAAAAETSDYVPFAIGMVNSKTTAVRIIPAPGKQVGDTVEFGGLLGSGPVQAVHPFSSRDFVARGGRIPAPMQSLKN